MRRLMTLFLAAALLMPLLAAAEGMPAWEYPLAPEILRDVDQYLTLTNRKTLLDKKYVPEDLVRMTVRSTVDENTDANVWRGRSRFNATFNDWRFAACGGVSGGSSL